jgi:flagellar protein FliJ
MPAFDFKLDGVLRHRKHVEKLHQRNVAQAHAQVSAVEADLRELDRSVRAASDELRANQLVGRIDLDFLSAHRRFIGAVQRKAIQLAQKLTIAQSLLEQRRSELTEAAKQRKILEKLQERQFQRWQSDTQRREYIQANELGMQIAFRNLAADDEIQENARL